MKVREQKGREKEKKRRKKSETNEERNRESESETKESWISLYTLLLSFYRSLLSSLSTYMPFVRITFTATVNPLKEARHTSPKLPLPTLATNSSLALKFTGSIQRSFSPIDAQEPYDRCPVDVLSAPLEEKKKEKGER